MNDVPTRVDTLFVLVWKKGLQGEDSRHKRGDTKEETSWEITRRYHFCSQSMVAISFQMALPYCELSLSLSLIFFHLVKIRSNNSEVMTIFDFVRRKIRRGWCRRQVCN